MQILEISGVLFDCDGVLADSLESAADAWDAWAATWAPEFDFRTQMVHGRRAEDLVATLVAAGDVRVAADALEQAEIEHASGTQNIPGAAVLTHALAAQDALRWGVVTSGTRPLALARLASAGIAGTENLVSGSDVEKGKPNPEPYLKGAAALRLAPSECVVFEDAPAGIASARAAGIGVVVGVGEDARVAEPDYLIQDLRQARLDNAGRLVLDLYPRA